MSTKISALPAASAGNITDATVLPLVDNTATTVKVTIAQLRTQLNAAAQTFGGDVTVSTGVASFVRINASTSPVVLWWNTGAAANNGKWERLANGLTMIDRVVNDAENSSTDYQTVTRSGTTISSIVWSGADTVMSGAALATNATTGHHYVPSCNGTPTGVPAGHTGTIALQYDTSTNKLWAYNGAWRSSAALA